MPNGDKILDPDTPVAASEEELLSRIVTRPGVLGGKPIIRGYRIAVEHILGYYSAGWTEQEILDSFPFLERDDLLACFCYAARELSGEYFDPVEESVAGTR